MTNPFAGFAGWLCLAESAAVGAVGFVSHADATGPVDWLCLSPLYSRKNNGLPIRRLALFDRIHAARRDARDTTALGGVPSRGRLGYIVCPCGHTTNASGCLRWVCFACSVLRRLALFGGVRNRRPAGIRTCCFS